jgi:hypothetical protein
MLCISCLICVLQEKQEKKWSHFDFDMTKWPGTKWPGTKWSEGQSDQGTKWPGTKWLGTKWPGDKETRARDKVTRGQSDQRTKWPGAKVTARQSYREIKWPGLKWPGTKCRDTNICNVCVWCFRECVRFLEWNGIVSQYLQLCRRTPRRILLYQVQRKD